MTDTKLTFKRKTRSASDKPRVAFCGTRGLPANYGGFETAIDHITAHFIRNGFECEVFCRESNGDVRPDRHEGRMLRYVAGSRHRVLDTFIASIQTGRAIRRDRRRYDCVMWFNNANLPGILLTVMARIPMVINTDGLEWKRAKWSWPFKLYYYLSSWIVSRLRATLVSDSVGIQNFYREQFGAESQFIPYGAPRKYDVSPEKQADILNKYELESGKYFLQITRIEPDNLPFETVSSFAATDLSRKGFRMVVVGYQQPTPYAERLRAYDGVNGVRILPANYDADELYALRRNCRCYVHGNSVGGTNPALLEAMAVCPRVVAIDIDFSREVLGESGFFFQVHNLAEVLVSAAMDMPDQSEAMRRRIAERYRWDEVARSYMNLALGHPAAYLETDRELPIIEREALREVMKSTVNKDHEAD
ncbi:MAG TPA: DUF1972 domain-containing protein [candidate division Zixibacteria bacterium]|nr:DUF1972 domain-containing protein [candidate division Zixibacteria bacterium]